jgi:hypothetical protein
MYLSRMLPNKRMQLSAHQFKGTLDGVEGSRRSWCAVL